MPLALSTGQELGLALVAAVFIAFALTSSFLLPRRNPDFPTERGLRRFVLASVVLFLAMMAAVLVFAREDEEAEGAHGEEAAETQTAPEPGETAPEQEEAQGDPEAGASVFQSAGCGGCHTLEAAGSSGTIGPNLNEAKPPHSLVVDRVTNGQGQMPSFSDRLDEKQIQDVAAYVVASTGGE